jgi:hypothetical protein
MCVCLVFVSNAGRKRAETTMKLGTIETRAQDSSLLLIQKVHLAGFPMQQQGYKPKHRARMRERVCICGQLRM